MCGIFGTTNPKRDLTRLIEANLQRGSAALSLFSPRLRLTIDDPTDINATHWPILQLPFEEESFVLGHVHAPTGTPNADRHPFQWRDWFVAHNGVIHDYEQYLEKEGVEAYPFHTDSSVIPLAIADSWPCLGDLNGTFACWAYNYTEKQTYLFRWVNPLYVSAVAFSSTPLPPVEFPGIGIATEIPEGTVLKWPMTKGGFEIVSHFKPKEHPYNSLWRHNR